MLNFDYTFSYDNNLKNLIMILFLQVLIMVSFSTFNYLSSGGVIGNDEIISNSSKIKLDKEKSLNLI